MEVDNMKIAALYDIHGNLPALNAVILLTWIRVITVFALLNIFSLVLTIQVKYLSGTNPSV